MCTLMKRQGPSLSYLEQVGKLLKSRTGPYLNFNFRFHCSLKATLFEAFKQASIVYQISQAKEIGDAGLSALPSLAIAPGSQSVQLIVKSQPCARGADSNPQAPSHRL